jgi:hypothetical protein
MRLSRRDTYSKVAPLSAELESPETPALVMPSVHIPLILVSPIALGDCACSETHAVAEQTTNMFNGGLAPSYYFLQIWISVEIGPLRVAYAHFQYTWHS